METMRQYSTNSKADLGFFLKGWMVLLIQEMFRNTWLGDSEGPFPSGRTCYEFLIVLFRHTSLGEA